MRILNIALVSVSDARSDTAQAVAVRELGRALAAGNHHVVVYARRSDERARPRSRIGPGATLRQVDAGPARRLDEGELLDHIRAFTDGLRSVWSAERPDVVHAHGWVGGLAACAVARELGIPFVESPHGLGAIERQAGRHVHPARPRLEKAIGREAAAVVTTCDDEAGTLVRMGVPRKKITVVPYGVDGDRFSRSGPALPHGDRDRLVAVCQDLEDGGVANAIRALAHIPGAELAVAGGPPPEELENDPAVHRLTVLAKEVHVAERVAFLGRVPRDSLPELLRTARLALCLAPHQPAPLVPLEAMACGVPVVASRTGGNADSVLDRITGLHVPADRPAVVGAAVRRLLAEETTLHGYAIAAADRAHSRFSWERVAGETLRAYTRVLPQEAAPALADPASGAGEALTG